MTYKNRGYIVRANSNTHNNKAIRHPHCVAEIRMSNTIFMGFSIKFLPKILERVLDKHEFWE